MGKSHLSAIFRVGLELPFTCRGVNGSFMNAENQAALLDAPVDDHHDHRRDDEEEKED